MPTLYDHFLTTPFEYEFFAAIRLLATGQPDRKAVGLEAAPADEIARFRPHLSLAFPPSQIIALDPPDDEREMPLLSVTFIGLYGPSRVLPTHYTQNLLDTHRDIRGPERRALRDWLDLFNHRFTSLFYRSWEKYRFPVGYERGEARRPDGDTFTTAVRSLMGFGSAGLSNRLVLRKADDGPSTEYRWAESNGHDPHVGRNDPTTLARIDDLGLIYYAGFFAQRPRNMTNLRALLADYFGLPVRIEPFVGQWMPVPVGDQMTLGGHGSLGMDAIVGERVWDLQSRFRVVLGPLRYDQFTELLPDRTPERPRKTLYMVSQLTRTFVGPEYEFDVQLVLAADQVPEVELVEVGGLGPRLGWNMWTISDTPPAPVSDAVFEGEWLTRV
jgi:type VI secretion system protein ImpH